MVNGPTRKNRMGPAASCPWTFLEALWRNQAAETREGSSTIEKRTPAL